VQLFKYYIWFTLLFFGQISTAQNIWPGDVNNNGVVNKIDLLYVGYAYGSLGTPRIEPSDTWEAKEAPGLWANNFPNGTNFAFADCNGDGIVDQLDANIVISNLDLQHDDVVFMPDEVPVGNSEVDPTCRFINTPPAAPVDQLFNLELALGNEEIPVDSLSGFTFFLNVAPDIIGKNALDFAEIKLSSDTWLDGAETASILVQERDLDGVKLKVAYTKTDQKALSGEGSIANPNSGLLIVESSEPILERITLLNACGKLVFDQALDKKTLQVVDIQDIPDGMYVAKIKTTKGIQTKKVFKYGN